MAEWLGDIRPVDPDEAVRCVFRLLRGMSEGEIGKVRQTVPKSLRQSWEASEQQKCSAAASQRMEQT